MYWFIGGIVVASIVLTAIITRMLVRQHEEQRLGEYQDKILKAQRDEVQSIYQTMRGWKHDYHNHMQMIKAHIALGQFEEVEHYLDQLEADLDEIDIAVRTGNISVDAILSSKLSVIKKRGIVVDCTAKVPDVLQVSDVDLCVIIGNLLDNALESCERVKEQNARFIRIYIGVFKGQLYLSISNSTPEDKRRNLWELVSGKKGNHGHGLKRIDTIVGKYEGYCNRTNEPGVFATEVMLPL